MSKILHLHHWGVTRLSRLLSLCQEASRQYVWSLPSSWPSPNHFWTLSATFKVLEGGLKRKNIARENTARVIYEKKKKKKKKMKKIRNCLTRLKSVFSQWKLIHNFKYSLRLRQRFFWYLVGSETKSRYLRTLENE